jgi:hypothetical protein
MNLKFSIPESSRGLLAVLDAQITERVEEGRMNWDDQRKAYEAQNREGNEIARRHRCGNDNNGRHRPSIIAISVL